MRSVGSFLIIALVLISCRSAPAQVSASTGWSEHVGCALPTDTVGLQITLPIEVLDQLERMSSSVFVHAFLIRYISADEAGQHRLARCARAFTNAHITEFGTMRQNLPDAAAIIDALRTAEVARQRAVKLADSIPMLDTVVARLRTEQSLATLELSAGQFASILSQVCGDDRRAACGSLDQVTTRLASLRAARAAVQAAEERVRQAAEVAELASADAQAAATSLAMDTASLGRATAFGSDSGSATVREAEVRIRRLNHVADSLRVVRDSVVGNVTRAVGVREREVTVSNDAQKALEDALAALQASLEKPGKITGQTPAALQGTPISAAVSSIMAPPAQSAAAADPAVYSANILLELTDFIIGRMRREAVNSFIVNLHDLARNEPLLQAGFPETWALMRGLSTTGKDYRLNAVEVGRIPLTAWRATLAGDFVQLPVNLLEAGPVAVCRGGESLSDSTLRAEATRQACRERVAVLTPLVPVATRLLEGEAVFQILRDAGSFTAPRGAELPPEWRRISQGLTILALLAEAYAVQGYVPTADPFRHPYLLTAQSVLQVPAPQRNAFMRLLLVRAVPSAADAPATVNEADLQNAASGAMRLLERIAARSVPNDPRPSDAGLVLRSTFDALVSATNVARVLAPADAVTQMDTIEKRWRAVSGALESITARDFGLALSRTTVLLRDLRGVEVPGPMITLAALASSLSEAQNGAQVQAAFETAASPVGGWQAKRYGEGGGSITAFPGAAVGFERVQREYGDAADVNDPALAVGASLPIGVEWQFRYEGAAGTSAPDCVVQVCGVGIFIPLIDLGALLSYRLDGGNDVESEPNASVRQVFAPGAYLSFALTRRVPLNLLVGGQLMPSLRSVNGTEGSSRRSAFRYGIGIGMDILLLKF